MLFYIFDDGQDDDDDDDDGQKRSKKNEKLKRSLIDTVKPAKITTHQKAFIDEAFSQKAQDDDHH